MYKACIHIQFDEFSMRINQIMTSGNDDSLTVYATHNPKVVQVVYSEANVRKYQ